VGLQTRSDSLWVNHIFTRQNLLLRKAVGTSSRRQAMAANVDTAFIATSANQEFNVRRIERMVATLRSTAIQPILVLTKADLAPCVDTFAEEARDVVGSIDIVAISTLTGQGLSDLVHLIKPGVTHMLLGSSGVGKSTLVNWLLGDARQTVLPTRGDDTGRHATTRRELFVLPNHNALLIDTPGMREFGLGNQEELGSTFAEIEALTSECRFRDCAHRTEPGCAVLEALDSGAILESRWRAYNKLRRELNHLDRRDRAKAAQLRTRDLHQKRHRSMKAVQRNKRRRTG